MPTTFIAHSSVDPIFSRQTWVPAHTTLRYASPEFQNSTATAFRSYFLDVLADDLGTPASNEYAGNQLLKPLTREEIQQIRAVLPPQLAASELYFVGEHPYPDPIWVCDANPGPCPPGRDHSCGGILSAFRHQTVNLIVCRGVLHTPVVELRDADKGNVESARDRAAREAGERNRIEVRERNVYSAAERRARVGKDDTAASRASRLGSRWRTLMRSGRFESAVLDFWHRLDDDMRQRLRATPEVYGWDEQRRAREYLAENDEAEFFGIWAFVAAHPERTDIIRVLKEDHLLATAFTRADQKFAELTALPDKRALQVWHCLSDADQTALRQAENGIDAWLDEVSQTEPEVTEPELTALDLDLESAAALSNATRQGTATLRLVVVRLNSGYAFAFRTQDRTDGPEDEVVYEGPVSLTDAADTRQVIEFDRGAPPRPEVIEQLRDYLAASNLDQYTLTEA